MAIDAISDHTAASYRQNMSWVIKKEDWDNGESRVHLILKNDIMNKVSNYLYIDTQRITFVTDWPLDLDFDLIHVSAEFRLKTSDGKCVVDILGQTVREDAIFEGIGFKIKNVEVSRLVTLNTELLFGEDGFFTLEADLSVEIKLDEAENSSEKNPNSFSEEIKKFFDEKNTDVVVISGDQEFKCHKAILSARSEVFKNTLAHNTVERATNTIVIKETPARAVEDMLKYIYSGDVPKDPNSLTTDLLHIADMHQLHPVVEACLKNLVESLEVSSCISTLVLLDRYLPQKRYMREMVIMFMQCKAMEVVEHEDWVKLKERSPGLAQELVRALARAIKEKHKCQFCVVSYY